MSLTKATDAENEELVNGKEIATLNDHVVPADPRQGATLLPGPIAAIITTGTGLASFSIRATTKVGGWTLYGFREGTLKSLSVSRSVVEQVLVLAGRDVAARSGGELGRQEAAGILEWSVC